MEKEDGEGVIPAFPFTFSNIQFPGMTLRDYFAAKALPKCLEEFWGEVDGARWAAEGAYQVADAMLEVRKK